jgi:general secretion pathway protein A
MFEEFFNLRENPFALAPNPRFIFQSHEHSEALAHLRYWIENREGFVLITGEVGTGKTTALFDLMAQLPTEWALAFVSNSTLTESELLEEICRRFHIEIPERKSKPGLLARLEEFLQQRVDLGLGALLILDEAQNFEPQVLEEVRLLSNLERPDGKLLQIALVGQPELERKLKRPELRQLRQRIGIRYYLGPLTEDETESYLHHRVRVAGGDAETIFPSDTARAIHRLTHGIPREINVVASQALITAFVQEAERVRPDHLQAVVEDFAWSPVFGPDVPAPPNRMPRAISPRQPGAVKPPVVGPMPSIQDTAATMKDTASSMKEAAAAIREAASTIREAAAIRKEAPRREEPRREEPAREEPRREEPRREEPSPETRSSPPVQRPPVSRPLDQRARPPAASAPRLPGPSQPAPVTGRAERAPAERGPAPSPPEELAPESGGQAQELADRHRPFGLVEGGGTTARGLPEPLIAGKPAKTRKSKAAKGQDQGPASAGAAEAAAPEMDTADKEAPWLDSLTDRPTGRSRWRVALLIILVLAITTVGVIWRWRAGADSGSDSGSERAADRPRAAAEQSQVPGGVSAAGESGPPATSEHAQQGQGQAPARAADQPSGQNPGRLPGASPGLSRSAATGQAATALGSEASPGDFVIQVASFKGGQEDIDAERERFAVLSGLPVTIVRAIVEDEYWNRVLIGSFDTLEEAETAFANLPIEAKEHGPSVRRMSNEPIVR